MKCKCHDDVEPTLYEVRAEMIDIEIPTIRKFYTRKDLADYEVDVLKQWYPTARVIPLYE